MLEKLAVVARLHQLRTNLSLNRIAVGRSEGIPQSRSLVVSPEVENFDADELRGRQLHRNAFRVVVDSDAGVGLEIDSGEKAPGDHDERSLRRSVSGVLIDHD